LGWLSNPTHDPDLIINAVPQSATIHISPLLFRKKPIIMDVNYRPKITDFIQNGIDNGCSDFVYGIDLLIAQCLEQNYIFTGKRVDQERAREVLRKEY
jgi:shikimate 5-dehydrogenase